MMSQTKSLRCTLRVRLHTLHTFRYHFQSYKLVGQEYAIPVRGSRLSYDRVSSPQVSSFLKIRTGRLRSIGAGAIDKWARRGCAYLQSWWPIADNAAHDEIPQ
jgi:hypothetical protein